MLPLALVADSGSSEHSRCTPSAGAARTEGVSHARRGRRGCRTHGEDGGGVARTARTEGVSHARRHYPSRAVEEAGGGGSSPTATAPGRLRPPVPHGARWDCPLTAAMSSTAVAKAAKRWRRATTTDATATVVTDDDDRSLMIGAARRAKVMGAGQRSVDLQSRRARYHACSGRSSDEKQACHGGRSGRPTPRTRMFWEGLAKLLWDGLSM